MFSLNPQITWLILPVVICLSQRRSLGHNQCGHEGRLVQFLLPPAATLCAVASLPLAPTMSAPAGAVTAHERLLAAVSAADALPRGATFQKVKGARDRLRAELSSVQRTDGDELVKSSQLFSNQNASADAQSHTCVSMCPQTFTLGSWQSSRLLMFTAKCVRHIHAYLKLQTSLIDR